MLAIVYGTAGYWLVEGKNLLEAFYETVLTLSTVGVGRARRRVLGERSSVSP